jgi:rRNA maturation RNase YbeY
LLLEGVKKSGEITCSTDVIAFDNSLDKRDETLLGDIAVSTDTAIRNARIYKTTPLYEIYLYVIHGVLHLLGYDDKTQKERKIMQSKADHIISTLSIKN